MNPVAEQLLRAIDRLMGGGILLAVVFGPWAFGTTTPWAIQVMNIAGLAAWGLLAAKWLLQWAAALGAPEWEAPHPGRQGAFGERLFGRALAVITGLILLYCLTSALNARATIHPEALSLDYHAAISWLPHSYASASSWQAFWKYLGLAGFFWAGRNWIQSGREEMESEDVASGSRHRSHEPSPLLPSRLRLLLWVLCINGALLGLEGIIQRTSGTNRLLWLVVPRINNTPVSQFGPYAYRANAAQYFNLLWPVSLGLWWTYQRARRNRGLRGPGAAGGRHHLLLSCAMVMAVCPVVSTRRGGAIILGAGMVLAGLVMWLAQWHSTWTAKLAMFAFLGGTVGAGVLLGWQELGPRFEVFKEGIEGREGLFFTGWRMAEECPLFGTGPGSFSDLYPLFLRVHSGRLPAQLHNDWLETFITFGWVGSSLAALALAAALLRWFGCGGIYGEKHFVMLLWISLAGCLLHAFYDFPFQVHSVLMVFVLLCAVLSCLSRRP
ncbi:MAG: O-antigen ligase family protein [Verrucomicrobia bacterium]|nr:O-antigen ligase family protein [Verrucomicrobiota bacterium]